MGTANINDRASLERLYPLAAFLQDAGQNDRTEAPVVHGVRIGSAPDDAGDFTIERASRHAGETLNDAFLAPYRHDAAPGGESHQQYEAFLEAIVDGARRHGYRAETSPGPGDPRIRGLRE